MRKKIILIAIIGLLIISCNTLRLVNNPTSTVTALPTTSYHYGDPTFTPPGSEITDPDFRIGVQAYKDRNFQLVHDSMQLVVQRSPKLAPPHWYLGRAYEELGDQNAALKQFETALSLDSNYALAYADRGRLRMDMGHKEDGLSDYKHALELNPSLAKVHHNLGVYYSDEGIFEQAAEEYRIALRIDPTRTVTWVTLAEMEYFQLDAFGGCIDSASRAIDLDPEYWWAYYLRGQCYDELNNGTNAIADLGTYTAAVPDDHRGWDAYCYVTGSFREYDIAIQACTTAIELNPSQPENYINRCADYIANQSFENAIADCTTALEFGEIPRAYDNRGHAYYYLGQYEKALSDYNRAIQLYPYDPIVFQDRGSLYSVLGQYELAIDDFTQAIALNPNDVISYQCRGIAYLELGQYASARSDFEYGLSICSDTNPATCFLLEDLLAKVPDK